jgi:hypothetical protein
MRIAGRAAGASGPAGLLSESISLLRVCGTGLAAQGVAAQGVAAQGVAAQGVAAYPAVPSLGVAR